MNIFEKRFLYDRVSRVNDLKNVDLGKIFPYHSPEVADLTGGYRREVVY